MDEKEKKEGLVARKNDDDSEVLQDRIKSIEAEIEMETENRKNSKAEATADAVSTKEPSPEHLLLRKHHGEANAFEIKLRDKYTDGQVSEIMGKILANLSKPKFPPDGVTLYRNWTPELMEDAKTGWAKLKQAHETLMKYPKQNAEQWYNSEKGEWVMFDKSNGSSKSKGKKRRIEDTENSN